MNKINLNKLEPESDGNWLSHYERKRNSKSADNKVQVYFDDIETHLINYIDAADGLIGCVAWLTNNRILEALARKQFVSIIVQKEDFLRPDIGDDNLSFKLKLRSRYKKLKCELSRYEMDGVIGRLSTNTDDHFESIRCMGTANRNDLAAIPRMHHKFVVFCNIRQRKQPHKYTQINPYAVWTGSFNFTENSVNSLENAVVIEDNDIARAYYIEYAHIFALSEPLDWDSEWIKPEYRIGT